jgi:hypothetical protein
VWSWGSSGRSGVFSSLWSGEGGVAKWCERPQPGRGTRRVASRRGRAAAWRVAGNLGGVGWLLGCRRTAAYQRAGRKQSRRCRGVEVLGLVGRVPSTGDTGGPAAVESSVTTSGREVEQRLDQQSERRRPRRRPRRRCCSHLTPTTACRARAACDDANAARGSLADKPSSTITEQEEQVPTSWLGSCSRGLVEAPAAAAGLPHLSFHARWPPYCPRESAPVAASS